LTIDPRFPTPVRNVFHGSNFYSDTRFPTLHRMTRREPVTRVYLFIHGRLAEAMSPAAGPNETGVGMSQTWARKNSRRIELIEKEFAQTILDADDEAELARLQDEVFDELDAVMPLPFEALERLEADARRIQARIDGEAGSS
jgi:hypothetical protein